MIRVKLHRLPTARQAPIMNACLGTTATKLVEVPKCEIVLDTKAG